MAARAAADAFCCTAMDLDDRTRAAHLGLTCSTSQCARRLLETARPDLHLVGGDG